jgi:Cys-rich protein (TIGR01571 family)
MWLGSCRYVIFGWPSQNKTRRAFSNFERGGRSQLGPREDLRIRYGIRGDAVTDCLISAFCRPCALTQERREMDLEEGSLRQ